MAKVKTSGFLPAGDPLFKQGAYLTGVNEFKTSMNLTEKTTDEEAKIPTASDESQSASLSKEQLRNLLGDFLDQLAESRPPAPASVHEHREDEAQQPPTEEMSGPTAEELYPATFAFQNSLDHRGLMPCDWLLVWRQPNA